MVLRALDIGGDKNLPYLPQPWAENPSLSKRGLRLMLGYPDILKAHFRALLRLSAQYPISILLPMVGSVEEALAAKQILDESKDELKLEGRPFNPRAPLGAMIETPAAAMIVARLAQVVDFFSLGTNDLVQYLLAADRQDPAMDRYYEPLHPAVLATIQSVVADAETAGKDLSICGDMAGDPIYTELLLGLGLRSFSVAPGEILELKKALRSVDLGKAVKLTKQAVHSNTPTEVYALLKAKTDRTGKF